MPFITKLGSVAARAYGWLASVAQAVVSSDTYFYLVSMLLPGNGTNGAQNNTFLDSSTNNFTITRNGNTTQGTFSPFSQTGWSNYFDGTGDTLSAPASAAFAFGTGDFTVEAWVYATTNVSFRVATNRNPAGAVAGTWGFTIASGNLISFNEIIAGEPGPSATIASIVNKWTHVAACRQSGTTRIFVDGVLVVSASQTTNFSSTAYSLVIGSTPATFLTGYISNLRIVKGTALYTTFFAPPIAPLTAITNTSLLTCQSNALVDNSVNRFAITRNGDTSVTANSPFAPNNFTPASYSGWFDGTGDYLSTTYGGGIAASQAFTFEFWIYPNGSIPVNTGIDTTQVTGGFLLYGGSTANTLVISRNSVSVIFTSTLAVTSNAWNHVAVARNTAGNLRMWINGANAGTITDSGAFTAASIKYIASQGAANYFTGYLSNYRWVVGTAVYDPTQTTITVPTAPLTAIANTSLLTLQNATFIDNSTNAFAITVNGNSQPVTTNPFQTPSLSTVPVSSTAYSGYFDGTGDYLSVPDNTALDVEASDFTIECFIYLFGTPVTKFVFAKRATGVVVGGVNVVFLSTLAPALYATVNNSTWALSQTSSVSCTLGWNHLAAVRNGTNWRLYVNGVVGVDATLSGTVPNNADAFTIGAGAANGSDTINALISNFRVVKGTAVYTAAFTPPTSPLTAITNTSLLTCQNSTFIDNSTNAFAITVAGNTVTTPVSPFATNNQTPISYSGSFDGTGDYLSVPRNAALLPVANENFTVEAWVYLTATPSATTAQIVGFGEYGTDSDWVFSINPSLQTTFYINAIITTFTATTTITRNSWNHVAVSRSGTGANNLKIFVNGVGQSFTTNSTTVGTGNRVLSIGADQNGDESAFPGYISNLRLVKGTAVYTANFTPPTVPLTAIANTSLLTCQSNRFVDNSTNNFTVTRNGDVTVTANSPFNPTAAWSATTNGGSGYFDGTGDYLTFPQNAAFNLATVNFTIEGWVYYTSIPAAGPVFSIDATSFPSVIIQNESGVLKAYATSASVSWDILNGASFGSISANAWAHFALTRSGSTFRTFLNGVLVTTVTSSASIENQGGPGRVGASDVNVLLGYISSFRVVTGTALYTASFAPPTAPLTAIANTALLLNYTNAGIYDAASQNVLETIGNAQISTAQSKWGGGSMAFDGTGDYLTVPDSPAWFLGTDNFTIEFWIYFSSFVSVRMLVQQGLNANNRWILYYSTTTGMSFDVASASVGIISCQQGSTAGWSINTWYHVALVRNGNAFNIYRNGTSIASATDTDSIPDFAGLLYIGGGAFPGDVSLNGYIDDLRITKFARYTANFTPPTAAFPTQ